MLIKKLFWPCITAVFFVAAMVLWFGAGATERQLSLKLAQMVEQNIWLSYEVNHDDVVLRGIAPNETVRDKIVAAVKALDKIDDIKSEITLPKHQDHYITIIDVKNDSVTISGFLPPNMDRFQLINQIEQQKPEHIVYDELEQATGDTQNFQRNVAYIFNLLPSIDEGEIVLNNNQISANQLIINLIKSRNDLPENLSLQTNF